MQDIIFWSSEPRTPKTNPNPNPCIHCIRIFFMMTCSAMFFVSFPSTNTQKTTAMMKNFLA